MQASIEDQQKAGGLLSEGEEGSDAVARREGAGTILAEEMVDESPTPQLQSKRQEA